MTDEQLELFNYHFNRAVEALGEAYEDGLVFSIDENGWIAFKFRAEVFGTNA